MTSIDLTKLSAHVMVDRKVRIEIIEKTVGFGTPIVETPDNKNTDCTTVLTSTGVIVIVAPDGMIVTTWIANVAQAISVYKRATNGKNLPKQLWKMIHYNNNTETWHKMVA